jgi:microsomal dipeptidase-like Zn-dependent dipeptidase
MPPFGDLRDGPFTAEKALRSSVRLFYTALHCEDRFNGEASLANYEALFRLTGDRLGIVLRLENADPLVGHPDEVSRLREKGILLVGLTHVGRNRTPLQATSLPPAHS